MLTKAIFFCTLVLYVNAQLGEEPAHPAPEPYSFTYESPNEDGSTSARQETGDAEGRITGFYIIKGLDGQDRRVDYVADENGFRAEVSTSELGTESHEAASAIYRSSAPSVAQLIAHWEASGGGAAGAAARRHEYASTTTTTSGGGLGVGVGFGAGGSSSGLFSASRSSTIQSAPAVALTAAKVTETSSSTSGAQVTPEGYVLVPASAAQRAGLQTIATGIPPALTGLTGNLNRAETFTTITKPYTTTTRVGGSRSFVTGGVTGGSLLQPEAVLRAARRKK